ncbi:MAG: hypothetical protein FJ217_14070 [Ignavibacteria bacterium]|nr:hypothetical protein [Ignavibacteria bacterium]
MAPALPYSLAREADWGNSQVGERGTTLGDGVLGVEIAPGIQARASYRRIGVVLPPFASATSASATDAKPKSGGGRSLDLLTYSGRRGNGFVRKSM